MNSLKSLLALALVAASASACHTVSAPTSSVKVVGGQTTEPGLFPELHITLNGADCSAQHIGGGVILTAQHCFIFTQTTSPVITISDDRQQMIMALSGTQYLTEKPAVVSTETPMVGGVHLTVPLPDLIAFTPKDTNLRAKLAKLPAFDLSFEKLDTTRSDLFLAGYGLKSYEDFEIDGQLRIGPVLLTDVQDLNYIGIWNKGGLPAGGAAGDSGGALFSVSVDGRILLHAVASMIEFKTNPHSGAPNEVRTRYVRLDVPAAKKWLTDLKQRYPSATPVSSQPVPPAAGGLPARLACKPIHAVAPPFVSYLFDFTTDTENASITRFQTQSMTDETVAQAEANWGSGPVIGLTSTIYGIRISPTQFFELNLGSQPMKGHYESGGAPLVELVCQVAL